ncbi:hypothetical protein [Pseudodesulfovibrio sp.]|uniref:hypothetical protein n=1 Tax=unclassified Pseudodesulfovibrio TaxID=2661612 RepID=UPI003B00C708
MKKYVVIGGGVIVVVAIVMIILAVKNLGTIIKTATETYGPKITKTDVKLGSADISILSGSGTLKDFMLGNPKGFTMPEALSCGTIRVKVDTSSLTSDTIVIKEIYVDGPVVSYEQKGSTDNFQTILNNIKKTVASDEKATKSSSKEEAKTETGAEKKIIIEDFVVKNGKINLGGSLLSAFGDKGMGIDLPDIHLTDIGKDKQTSPAEAFSIILKEMTGDVGGAVTDMGKQLKEQMGKAVDGVTNKAGSALKGLFGGSE